MKCTHGAFTFDNNDYLLEAKWQEKTEINAADLYTFGGKISGKLKNTLGLFISLGPFSKDCTETGSPITKSMILMDGMDLMQVLEGRIRLNELILIKRRHASQTGEIYYRMK
ncbi:MAG: restriction endonuclease [Chitinophagaceae bacterium]|nr:restriction endonuclease [Chitinophagaceae bacterium]